jgi:hypothetical protein
VDGVDHRLVTFLVGDRQGERIGAGAAAWVSEGEVAVLRHRCHLEVAADAGSNDFWIDEDVDVRSELCQVLDRCCSLITFEGGSTTDWESVELKSRLVPWATKISGSPSGPKCLR